MLILNPLELVSGTDKDPVRLAFGIGGGLKWLWLKALLMSPRAEAVDMDGLRLRELVVESDIDAIDATLRRRDVAAGLALAFAIRLKIPRKAEMAASTEFWIELHEYSRRMKSSISCSISSICLRQTQTASAMMVVPVIQALAMAS
jgi:hypothetical protein